MRWVVWCGVVWCGVVCAWCVVCGRVGEWEGWEGGKVVGGRW